MIPFLRASYRITIFAVGSLYYITRYVVKAAFIGYDLDRILRLRKQWFAELHSILGVKIQQFGEPPASSGLILCNHRSYYDPLLVLSDLTALPVGKAQMAKWPIIGVGARISGVIFVERKSKEGRSRARVEITNALKSGYSVINYPEGTTHTQPRTVRFKPAMFKEAASEGFPIYPVALEYQRVRDAWIGRDNFLQHFFECFGKKNTYVKLSYGPKIEGDQLEELLTSTKSWIDKELSSLRKNWHDSEKPEAS